MRAYHMQNKMEAPANICALSLTFSTRIVRTDLQFWNPNHHGSIGLNDLQLFESRIAFILFLKIEYWKK